MFFCCGGGGSRVRKTREDFVSAEPGFNASVTAELSARASVTQRPGSRGSSASGSLKRSEQGTEDTSSVDRTALPLRPTVNNRRRLPPPSYSQTFPAQRIPSGDEGSLSSPSKAPPLSKLSDLTKPVSLSPDIGAPSSSFRPVSHNPSALFVDDDGDGNNSQPRVRVRASNYPTWGKTMAMAGDRVDRLGSYHAYLRLKQPVQNSGFIDDDDESVTTGSARPEYGDETSSIGFGTRRFAWTTDDVASVAAESVRPTWIDDRIALSGVRGSRSPSDTFMDDTDSVAAHSVRPCWMNVGGRASAMSFSDLRGRGKSATSAWSDDDKSMIAPVDDDETMSQRPQWMRGGPAPSVASRGIGWTRKEDPLTTSASDDDKAEGPVLLGARGFLAEKAFGKSMASRGVAFGQSTNPTTAFRDRSQPLGWSEKHRELYEAPADHDYGLAAKPTSPAGTMGGQSSSEGAARPLSELTDLREQSQVPGGKGIGSVSDSSGVDDNHPVGGNGLLHLILNADDKEAQRRKHEKMRNERTIGSGEPLKRQDTREATEEPAKAKTRPKSSVKGVTAAPTKHQREKRSPAIAGALDQMKVDSASSPPSVEHRSRLKGKATGPPETSPNTGVGMEIVKTSSHDALPHAPKHPAHLHGAGYDIPDAQHSPTSSSRVVWHSSPGRVLSQTAEDKRRSPPSKVVISRRSSSPLGVSKRPSPNETPKLMVSQGPGSSPAMMRGVSPRQNPGPGAKRRTLPVAGPSAQVGVRTASGKPSKRDAPRQEGRSSVRFMGIDTSDSDDSARAMKTRNVGERSSRKSQPPHGRPGPGAGLPSKEPPAPEASAPCDITVERERLPFAPRAHRSPDSSSTSSADSNRRNSKRKPNTVLSAGVVGRPGDSSDACVGSGEGSGRGEENAGSCSDEEIQRSRTVAPASPKMWPSKPKPPLTPSRDDGDERTERNQGGSAAGVPKGGPAAKEIMPLSKPIKPHPRQRGRSMQGTPSGRQVSGRQRQLRRLLTPELSERLETLDEEEDAASSPKKKMMGQIAQKRDDAAPTSSPLLTTKDSVAESRRDSPIGGEEVSAMTAADNATANPSGSSEVPAARPGSEVATEWLERRARKFPAPMSKDDSYRSFRAPRLGRSNSFGEGSMSSFHGPRPLFSPGRFNAGNGALSWVGSADESWCEGSMRSFRSCASLMSARGLSDRRLAAPQLSNLEKQAVAGLKIDRADVHISYRPVRGSVRVYRADLNNEKRAAKVMDLQGVSKDAAADVLETFETELLALSRLDAPNIVKVYGASVSPSEIVMVSEFIEGGTLRDVLRDSRKQKHLKTRMRLSIAQDVAEGMKSLYAHGMQHRQLSSSAILLTNDWQAKIVGVGLNMTMEMISFFNDEVKSFEQSEDLPWASREVVLGAGFSEKSDVYSFGIVLWEIMQTDGSLPFAGMMPEEVIGAKYQGQCPTIPSNCSPAMRSLMTSCWSILPEHRPSFDTICKTLEELVLPTGDTDHPIGQSSSGSFDGAMSMP